MIREYNINKPSFNLLYKGLPYPGLWFGSNRDGVYDAKRFEVDTPAGELKTESRLGTPLRKKDALGHWYFLPVIIEHEGKEYELPNSVIKITGRKKIIETDMTGRKGSVKELISLNDYEITITGAIVAGDFPEKGISMLNRLYNINESVSLKCALTDIFLGDDKVVIKDIDLAEMKGTEQVQVFAMNLVSDNNFELIIK